MKDVMTPRLQIPQSPAAARHGVFGRFFAALLIPAALALGACATGGAPGVGPGLSTAGANNSAAAKSGGGGHGLPRIDVLVPVFDPGLPEDSDEWEKRGIYPELRRAEATRFALKMKAALDKTGAFGSVRVAPSAQATGELYVNGKILESNGEDVRIEIAATDISGRKWLGKKFSHRAKEAFHRDPRNKNRDAYDPVFEEAAEYIVKRLKKRDAEELAKLQRIAAIRFGGSLSAETFARYLKTENGRTTLVAAPADDDPMLQRIAPLRVRDQLFIDNMQSHYASFDGKLQESYLVWQEQSLIEVKAARKAKLKATGQGILGGLLVAASVVAGADSDNSAATEVATTIGTVAGAVVLAQSFQTRSEMQAHRAALAELGRSIDIEVQPQVVAYEKETAELTGSAAEQHEQWIAFLKKIYELEATPETEL